MISGKASAIRFSAFKIAIRSSDTEITFWNTFGLLFFLLYALLVWPAFILFQVPNIWMLVRRDQEVAARDRLISAWSTKRLLWILIGVLVLTWSPPMP